MHFRLTNAPSTFQGAMNDLFIPDPQTHQQHLQTALNLLSVNFFFPNPKKCLVNTKLECLVPKNLKELRGFLGLNGYYRHFVKYYGIIACPLKELTKKDAFIWHAKVEQIRDQLSYDLSIHPDFSLSANHIYYKSWLVIPDYLKLKAKILADSHDSPTGGKRGYSKTLKRKHKYETLAPAGLLQPLPIPNRVWEDTSLDFIVGLPPSKSFDTILVVEYSFNTGYHSSTNMTPFQIVYGRGPTLLHPFVHEETKIVELEQQLMEREQMLQKSLAKRINEKLSPRHFGPYKIIRRVGPVSYELKLPETSK
uniref:Tf2-1-like SH3-like domain-containing protein n=1 Tax=Solanum lycopersicum TaxID=4081 RepID=A0A3Q7HLR3_SOLLC